MTEPTITCPNCKTEIRLTESLAAPLIAATRKQFEQQLAEAKRTLDGRSTDSDFTHATTQRLVCRE